MTKIYQPFYFAPGNYIEVIRRVLNLLILKNMDKTSYDYPLKNIPIPSKTSYNLKLIEKIESVIKRRRWKAYFFLNERKSTAPYTDISKAIFFLSPREVIYTHVSKSG